MSWAGGVVDRDGHGVRVNYVGGPIILIVVGQAWSTNLLERVNEEINRRTRVVGICPSDAAIIRLPVLVLLEMHEHWQLERRRFFSEATLTKIPEPEERLELTDADPSAHPAASTS